MYHRKVLPDFSDPSFNPMLFQLESKKFHDKSSQTGKTLVNLTGRLRIREKIERQGEEMRAVMKSVKPESSPRVGDSTSSSFSSSSSSSQTPHATASSLVADFDDVPVLTPSEVVKEIARLYVKKIHADAEADAKKRKRQRLVEFIQDVYLQELGFKAMATKKLTRLLIGAKESNRTQERVRIKWFTRFVNTAAAMPISCCFHPIALDFYLLTLQRLVPLDQLQFRLEDELYNTRSITYVAMQELVDEPLINRLLVNQEQRQQLLLLQISGRDASSGLCSGGGAGDEEMHSRRRDPALLEQSSTIAMLHVDDILDAIMNVWLQYQER